MNIVAYDGEENGNILWFTLWEWPEVSLGSLFDRNGFALILLSDTA